MAKQRSISVRRPIHTPLSNSLSAASSLSSSNCNVKTIRVFKNGDPYDQGTKFVLNRRYVHNMEQLLNMISEKFDLPYGAKKLYTYDGRVLKHLAELEDKHDYVASSNHFIPQKYGALTDTVSYPPWNKSAVKFPPIRTSRSQTRIESKPSIKKRSQSGTTTASTTSNFNPKTRMEPKHAQVSVSNADRAVASLGGNTIKRKAVKKKKKIEESINTKSEERKENEKESTVVEMKKETMKKEEIVELAKNESCQTESKLPLQVRKSIDDRENHHEKSKTPSDSRTTPSEHGNSDFETESDESDSEKEHSPDRPPTPKSNGKTRRPSVSRKTAKVESSESTEGKKKAEKKIEPTNWGDLSSFTRNIEALLRK